MKNITKFGIISGFLVVGAFFLFSNSAQASFASTAVSAGESDSPRSLYVQNCASCHGSNGKAQTAKGKKLEADDISGGHHSVDKTIRVVTKGKGKMPGFGRRLTAAEISQIASYVQSL